MRETQWPQRLKPISWATGTWLSVIRGGGGGVLKIIIGTLGFMKSEIRCKTELDVVIHVPFALGKLAWPI